MSRYWNAFNASKGAVDSTVNAFRQGEKDNALRAYATNPNAPGAIGTLAQYDPALAIKAQGDITERTAAAIKIKQERDTKMIAGLAQGAKTPEQWDAAVDQVASMGYPDAVQFKGKFSPALRSALMAAGGVKDDSTEPTTFQRDAMAAGIQPGTPEFAAAFKARQLRYVTDANGNIKVVDPTAFIGGGGPQVPNAAPGQGAGPPAVLTDDDWDGEGGQTPPASAGFPDIGGYRRY